MKAIPICFMVLLLSGCASITTTERTAVADTGSPLPTWRGAQVDTIAPNRFHVRLTDVRKIAAKQPRDTQLCWAACAQMVLRAGGRSVSQDDLALHFARGNNQDGASGWMMMRALNPDLEQEYLQTFDALQQASRELTSLMFAGHAHSDFLIEELSKGEPAVIGLRDKGAAQGHTCVVVGATYSVARVPTGLTGWFIGGFREGNSGRNENERIMHEAYRRFRPQFVLHEVELIDPDPDAPLTTRMQATELKQRVGFLFTARLARAHVEEAIRAGKELRRRQQASQRKTITTTTYKLQLGNK